MYVYRHMYERACECGMCVHVYAKVEHSPQSLSALHTESGLVISAGPAIWIALEIPFSTFYAIGL